MAAKRTSWAFDEVAHAGPEHLDPAYVAAYDAKAPTEWSEEIAELRGLGIGSTSTVVDIGAGTGAFALALAPHVARVVAVDVSPAMVAAMHEAGVEAVHAGFLGYEHSGDRPDAVVTRNALHHLPDFWKVRALQRIAELLRPGGVLLLEDIVYSFALDDADAAIGDWLAKAPSDPSRGWTAEQLAEHLREEHSTFAWLLDAMLQHAGFDIRRRWLSDGGTYAAYTCVRRSEPGSPREAAKPGSRPSHGETREPGS